MRKVLKDIGKDALRKVRSLVGYSGKEISNTVCVVLDVNRTVWDTE
jgi:hypothetical protein